MIYEIHEEEVKEFVGRDVILIDFYSKTCGPCKMLAFILAEVDQELGGEIPILKVEFEDNSHLNEEYGVTGYPTLVLLKQGKEVARMTGLHQKPEIVRMIKEAI